MNDDIIEIIEDATDNVSPQNNQKSIVGKNVSEFKYNAIEPELETIEIIDDFEPSKNKSGIVLVIILFVILIIFIIFLPQISEILGNIF